MGPAVGRSTGSRRRNGYLIRVRPSGHAYDEGPHGSASARVTTKGCTRKGPHPGVTGPASNLPWSELGWHAMSRWDVRWKGIELAVRTTGTVNSSPRWRAALLDGPFRSTVPMTTTWSSPKTSNAVPPTSSCWRTTGGTALLEGWTFHVRTSDELNRLPERITPPKAQIVAPAVTKEEVASAIEGANERRRPTSSS